MGSASNSSTRLLEEGHGRAEYFVGGWCIGTVIDSAASRSMSHNTVRSAPSTMAINVDVNVDWWSADKLYQHYQGVDAGDYDATSKASRPSIIWSFRGLRRARRELNVPERMVQIMMRFKRCGLNWVVVGVVVVSSPLSARHKAGSRCCSLK